TGFLSLERAITAPTIKDSERVTHGPRMMDIVSNKNHSDSLKLGLNNIFQYDRGFLHTKSSGNFGGHRCLDRFPQSIRVGNGNNQSVRSGSDGSINQLRHRHHVKPLAPYIPHWRQSLWWRVGHHFLPRPKTNRTLGRE